MELRRDIYKKLLKWKEADTGNILELRGARQVGKTYILKKFGKENFKKMIYINMVELSGRNFLKCISMAMEEKQRESSVDSPFKKALKLYDPEFIDDKDTVIIIDEIQESIQVYNQICAFVRVLQSYVMVAGSYLGMAKEDDLLLRASNIDHMILEPLTFDEFLDALGERELIETIDFSELLETADSEKLLLYYDIYQRIGGYPPVVISYAMNRDEDKCFEIIRGLVELYSNESRRYFKNIVDVNMFQKLLNALALMMIQEECGEFDWITELNAIAYQGESTTKHAVRDAIDWLQESHMIECVSEVATYGDEQIKDNGQYYFLDMGIAHYFLCRTGAPFEMIKEVLRDNLKYLMLRNRV